MIFVNLVTTQNTTDIASWDSFVTATDESSFSACYATHPELNVKELSVVIGRVTTGRTYDCQAEPSLPRQPSAMLLHVV